VIEVVDAVAELLEPWTPSEPMERDGSRTVVAQSGVTVDLNSTEPTVWRPNTLYLWVESDTHNLAGVGNPPEEREDFTITAIYVLDAGDEEAKQRRTRSVSEGLDQKAHEYAAAIAANRSKYAAGGPAPWQHLQSVLDNDLLRAFNVRGIGLRIEGYRYLRG